MNKGLLAGIGIVVVIVAIVAYLMTTKRDGDTTADLSENTANVGGTQEPTSTTSTAKSSLKDLLALGTAQKCTFSSTTESATSEGVFYVSGGKARGDFTSAAGGQTTTAHTIVDGQTSYVWTDGSSQGFKTSLSATQSTAPTTTGQTQSVDVNDQLDYNCSLWVATPSSFTPPTNIQFVDLQSYSIPTLPQ